VPTPQKTPAKENMTPNNSIGGIKMGALLENMLFIIAVIALSKNL
jgi:hypothetical protein